MGAFVWKRGADSSASAHAAPANPPHTLQQHTSSNGVTATTLVPPSPCSRRQSAQHLPQGHSQQQNGQPSLKRKQHVLGQKQPWEEQHPNQPGLQQHSCPHHNHQHKRQRTSFSPHLAPPSSGSQHTPGAPQSHQPPSSAQPGQPPPNGLQGPSRPQPTAQQHHHPRHHQPQGPAPPAHRSSSQQQQGPGVSSSPLQESHRGGPRPSQAEPSASLQDPATSHTSHTPSQAHPPQQGPPPRQPHAHRPHQLPPQRPPGPHRQHPPPHRPPHAQPQRPSSHSPAPTGPNGTAGQHKRGHIPENTSHGDSAAALAAKQAELEALRRRLHVHEKQVAQQKAQQAAMEAAKEAARLQRQAEVQKCKAQLEKGFRSMAPSSATGDAASHPAAAAASAAGPKLAFAIADELELERILDCKSDLECLKLAPGASVEQVRRSFKGMAMAVHPDKCSLPGAAEAFQRLSAAYNRLNKQSG